MKRLFESRWLFGLTLAVIFYGLFMVPGDQQASRAWTQFWNLGHIAAFLVVWTFLFQLYPRLSRLSLLKLFLIMMLSGLLIAELIEIVQGWIGRDNEWQDVWDSGAGAFLALCFSSPQIKALTIIRRRVFRTLAIIVVIVVPWVVWSNLIDSVLVYRQFPVLSDFRTPFEMTRWQASHAEIMEQAGSSGKTDLSVNFQPGRYSTVSLIYFRRDWRGYHKLVLDVDNPDKQAYSVILRIHDRWHRQHHFALSDRFNRRIVLQPGKQHIVISLAEVAAAPETREMDMSSIEQLSLFTMDSRVSHKLYIDRVYLE